jgi:hypothetical protein
MGEGSEYWRACGSDRASFTNILGYSEIMLTTSFGVKDHDHVFRNCFDSIQRDGGLGHRDGHTAAAWMV